MASRPDNSSDYHYHIGIESCGGPNYSGVPCFRAVVCGIAAVATLLAICVKLRWATKSEHVEPAFVVCFGLAFLETAILSIRWIVGGDVSEHFIALYLHVVQFGILCMYYTRRVLVSHKRQRLVSWVCYPAAAVIFLYFTVVLVLALTHLHPNAKECQSVVWLLYSGSMIGLAVVFVVLGVLLTRAMNKFPTADGTLVWWKRLHLWSLIVAYTLSAAIELSFDLAFQFMTQNDENCDGIYGGPSSFGYTMYILTERLSLVGPVWVMLAVLKCGSHTTGGGDGSGATVSVFKSSNSPRGTIDSLDSANQWDPDDLGGFDINGVFDGEDATETSALLPVGARGRGRIT